MPTLTAATATPGVTYLDQKSLKITIIGPDPAGSAKIQAKGVSGSMVLLAAGYPLSPLPGVVSVAPAPTPSPTRVSQLAGKPRDVLEPMLPDLSDAELEALGADDTRHWVGHEILKEIDRRAAVVDVDAGQSLFPWETSASVPASDQGADPEITSPSDQSAIGSPAGDNAPSLAYCAGRDAFACPFYDSLAEAEADPTNRDFDAVEFAAGWEDAKRAVRTAPTDHAPTLVVPTVPDEGAAVATQPVGDPESTYNQYLADSLPAAIGNEPPEKVADPSVSGTTRDPRGYCLACGKDVAVKKDGTAREHKARAATAPGPCAGSGKATLDHRPTTQEMAKVFVFQVPEIVDGNVPTPPAGDPENVATDPPEIATDDQVLEWIVEAHHMVVSGRGSHGECEALVEKAVAARPALTPTAAPVLAVLKSRVLSGEAWDRVETGLVSLRALVRARAPEGQESHVVAGEETSPNSDADIDIDTDHDDPDKIHAPAVNVGESADNADNKSTVPLSAGDVRERLGNALDHWSAHGLPYLRLDEDDRLVSVHIPSRLNPATFDAIEARICDELVGTGWDLDILTTVPPLRTAPQEPPVPTASPTPDPLAELYRFLLVRMNVAGDDREIADAWPQDAVDKVLALTGTVRENSTALVGCYDREVIAAALAWEEAGKARGTILDKLRERLKQIDAGAAKAPNGSAPAPEAPASSPSKPVYVKIPAVSESDRSRATTVSHHLAIVSECLPFVLALRASLDALREAGVVLDVGIELTVAGRS